MTTRNRTRNLVLLSMLSCLFWLANSCAWAPFSALLLKRTCIEHGLHSAAQCTAKAGGAHYKAAQSEAANRLSAYTLVMGLSNCASATAIGVLSDSIGRKPVIALCLLAYVVQVLNIWYWEHFEYMAIGIGFLGLGGGQYAITGAIFAAVADITER